MVPSHTYIACLCRAFCSHSVAWQIKLNRHTNPLALRWVRPLISCPGCNADKERQLEARGKLGRAKRLWKMVLFVPRRHDLRIRGGMATGQWQIVDLLSCLQSKLNTRLLHSHGHTNQCFLLVTVTDYLSKKVQSGKAALYEFVRKNQIMCTIAEIS